MSKPASHRWIVGTVTAAALLALAAFAPAGQAQLGGCDTIDASGTWELGGSFSTDADSNCLVVQADDVEIVGNDHTIDGSEAGGGAHGIYVDSSSNVTLGNLSLTSFPGDGIHATGSDNVTIDNVTTSGHQGSGATIHASQDSLVQASETSDNGAYGVNLSGLNLDNDVRGSTIQNNTAAGVYVSGDTGGSEIVDNRFNNENNTEFGPSPLANAWNTPVSDDENVLGFQAYGGNFWATPAGDGFSQTCDDADQNGYCDASNSLAANNQDGTPLARLGTLEGTITDPDGDPIEGVTVNVFDQAAGVGKSTDTDAEGSYAFELPPGSYGVDIQPTDYGSMFAHGIEVSFEQTTTENFQLSPTGTLAVTVEDGDGAAIENATVEAFDQGKTTFQQANTDANGTVSLDVATGTYTVVADQSGLGQVVNQGNDVSADTTTSLTLTLQQGAYINGTVEDGQGTGVQGATVLADDGDRFSFAQTDASGGYSLEVGAGTYNVMVFHQPQTGEPSHARADGEIQLATGEETSLNFTLKQPTITGENVRILDGPGQEGDIDLDVSVMSGLLGVRLLDESDNPTPGMPYDLGKVGMDSSTQLEINFTVEDYDPSALLWGGANVSWTTATNASNANATDVSIQTTPIHLAGIEQQGLPVGPLMGQNPEQVSWPSGKDDKADANTDWNTTVYLGLFDLSTVPSDRAQLLQNMTVTTNAQAFTIPQVKDDRLRVWVAGPATTSNGENHDGFYRAFIPDAQLDAWDVSDPASDLAALYKGSSADFTVNETDDGAWLEMSIDYSSGSVDIEPSTSSGGGGGGGGGLASVSEGETHATRPGSSFRADAGATVSLDRGTPEGLEEVAVTFAEECNRCEIQLEAHDSPPEASPAPAIGFADVRYLTMDVMDSSADVVEDAVEDGEVTFTVAAEELGEHTPEQVVLLHDEGDWQPLATTLEASADAEASSYKAELPGFSAFAISVDEEPPAVVEPAPEGKTSGPIRTVAATLEDNRELATDTVQLSLDGVEREPFLVDDRATYVAEEPLAVGDHTVEIQAEDASGLAMSEAWSFHVPCEQAPRLYDLDAEAGELLLEIEAGTCEVIDAEVKLEGEPVDADLDPVPAGERSTFTVPVPGDVDLSQGALGNVVLTDAAGDEVTGAAHVQASSASDAGASEQGEPTETPAAGLVAVLASLAAAGAVRARRR